MTGKTTDLWTKVMRRKDSLLITGVTGLLGGTVASELLRQGRAHQLLFLVRADHRAQGLQRVLHALSRFDLSPKELKPITTRQIICGGLSDLPSAKDDERLAGVTHVLNSAGVTSFAHHSKMWQTNVVDTVSFAKKVARLPKLKRFIHLGTAMICGAGAGPSVLEKTSPSATAKHLVEYTETKAEAERQLRQAMVGVPFVVARPSIVVGHTRLGCRPSGSIFWTLRVAECVGGVTGDVDARIDLIPADYAARAILHLMFKPKLSHKTYHISSSVQNSVTFREIGHAFGHARGSSNAPEFRHVPFSHIVAMKNDFPKMFGQCNRRFMLKAIKLYGHFAALNITFDNRRLLKEGFERPIRFTEYLPICLTTSERVSIADQLLYDFHGSSVSVGSAP